jgi:hypothetical protein
MKTFVDTMFSSKLYKCGDERISVNRPTEPAIVQEWRKVSQEIDLAIYHSWIFAKHMKAGAEQLKEIHENRAEKLNKIDEGFAYVSDLVDEIVHEIYEVGSKVTNSMVENDETVDFLKLVALVWIIYAVF